MPAKGRDFSSKNVEIGYGGLASYLVGTGGYNGQGISAAIPAIPRYTFTVWPWEPTSLSIIGFVYRWDHRSLFLLTPNGTYWCHLCHLTSGLQHCHRWNGISMPRLTKALSDSTIPCCSVRHGHTCQNLVSHAVCHTTGWIGRKLS